MYCPGSCLGKPRPQRIEMILTMLRGIGELDRGIPTTLLLSGVDDAVLRKPLPKQIEDELVLLRRKGIVIAHYVQTRIPDPTPCCVCCNSFDNITKYVDDKLSAYPEDVIFYDNGPFPHQQELFLKLYHYAATWGGRSRQVLFNPMEMTSVEEVYASNTSATLNAFEGFAYRWSASYAPSFAWGKYPPSRFGLMLENVSTPELARQVVLEGASLHFGTFFVTSQACDYSILPTYWPDVVDLVRGLNNGSVPVPPPPGE